MNMSILRFCSTFGLIVCLLLGQSLSTHAVILSPEPLPADMTPADAVVARVYFADQADLNRLAGDLDVWEVHHSAPAGERYFVARLTASELASLRQRGYRVVIDQPKSARLSLMPVMAAEQNSGIPSFACYRTVEETFASLEQIAQTRPTLARWIDIGDSWNLKHPGNGQGYDLRVLVLTNQAIAGPKPIFFLMGAIHARELTTAESVTRFAEHLINGYGRDADITWLLDYTEIHLLPVTNPDGRKRAEQLLSWRKNTNNTDGCLSNSYGVDLNRNHSFKWAQCEGFSCSSAAACNLTFRGSAPASEPETQALQSYISTLFADQRGPADTDAAPLTTSGLLISLHSYSQLVLFPWGWSEKPSPNYDQLQTLGKHFGYFTGYQACQGGAPGCIYQTDGTTDDWAYGELGVAAYTFELGTDFFEQCSYFEETIYPQEVLPALLYAAKAARRPYQTPAGPEALQIVVTPTRVLSGTVVTLQALADDTRFDNNQLVFEPTQPISTARYTVDAPAWITGTQVYSMTAADGLFNNQQEIVTATIDTRGWAPGKHLILVEGQDQAGNWGVPSAAFVEILPGPLGVTLSGPKAPDWVRAGNLLTQTLTVTNTGLLSDTYRVTVAPNAWPVTVTATIGPLQPATSAPLTVTVRAPLTATLGTTNTVTLTVTSQSSNTTQAHYRLVAEVIGEFNYFPLITRR